MSSVKVEEVLPPPPPPPLKKAIIECSDHEAQALADLLVFGVESGTIHDLGLKELTEKLASAFPTNVYHRFSYLARFVK